MRRASINAAALLTLAACVLAVAVIDGNKTSQPLPWTAVTKLPKRPGGVGGNVLALNILQIGGTPKLVLLSTTTAVFRGR